MSLYILIIVITCSIMLFLYFLSGVFYIIQKPQIIINKKLCKTRKQYNITSINEYLNNLGKSYIFTSILFALGLIAAIYLNEDQYPYSSVALLIYAMFINILSHWFKKRIQRYLRTKDTETFGK